MPTSFEPGTVVAGKYRIERLLGEGGMGVVLEAKHVALDTPVAIKFMHPHAASNEEAARRFTREAKAAARLRSEHVARVLDFGSDDDTPYIVIELLVGSDLSELLRAEGSFPVSAAVEYVMHACEALEEAHSQNIVHRDIKPSNLFLTHRPTGEPSIKVLDFGVSKITAPDGAGTLHSTSTGSMLGSPLYMSPEQLRSARDVDARSDLWALGATLHELLTGLVPFPAESIMDLCLKVTGESPIPVHQIQPDVPEALAEIVMRCLERDPQKRFQTARELRTALRPYSPAGASSSLPPDRHSGSLPPRQSDPALREAPRPPAMSGSTLQSPTPPLGSPSEDGEAGAGESAVEVIAATRQDTSASEGLLDTSPEEVASAEDKPIRESTHSPWSSTQPGSEERATPAQRPLSPPLMIGSAAAVAAVIGVAIWLSSGDPYPADGVTAAEAPSTGAAVLPASPQEPDLAAAKDAPDVTPAAVDDPEVEPETEVDQATTEPAASATAQATDNNSPGPRQPPSGPKLGNVRSALSGTVSSKKVSATKPKKKSKNPLANPE